MSLRTQSRELALQVLFQREFSNQLDLDSSLELFKQSFHAPKEVWTYARKILGGIESHRAEIDQKLSASSAHWSVDRMSLVDANIMRIAIFEIAFSDGEVPPKVAINEALEISKKYSNSEAFAFINGVLDQVVKGL